MDAGRPEHDEGDEFIEYDLYGWFQFESHADGVQCLTSDVGAAARPGAGRRLEGGGSEAGGEAEDGRCTIDKF